MKDFWEEPEQKKVNKKKIVIAIIIAIIVISIITITIIYINNKDVREWIDKNIFRKEVMQDKVATIELKEGENPNIYAFNKYIGILIKNKFSIYGNTGNKEKELEVQISSPIFDSANRFLAIAETKGQKFYVITDKEIAWESSIEGEISQIHINKNGYVAVAFADSIHKTVISVYNSEGTKLFTSYLSSNRTTDINISNNNKYLAIAEVDTSGTIIQSGIKVISIEKASTDPTNSVENTYKSANGKLITNIQYQEKDKLICMYTDSINIIENGQESVLIDNTNKKITFQSIELNNNVASIEEKSTGLFTADSVVNIINTENRNTKEYIVNSVTKEIYIYDNIIALNLGTEIEFISTSGWLVKRYIANQEITNVVVSNNLSGIIYRDKIEIINL